MKEEERLTVKDEPRFANHRIVARQREVRILLVEDSPADAELIERELRKGRLIFVTKRVQTKQFYLQELHDFSPDVILADFTLPQFGGLEALKLLKDLGLQIPFILVTGSQSEEVAVQCIKEGADDYILKQSLTRLPSAILNALERVDSERQRIAAERALRHSEKRFRLLFDLAPLPIWVYDLDSLRVLEANRAAVDHYGYSRSEFLRLSIDQIQEPPDLIPEQNQVFRFLRHRTKDQRWIDVQVVAHVIEFFGRRAVLMISEDITERRKVEADLRSSRQQLRELSAHLQTIREDERKRIAREIHDELGQALTALKIDTALIGTIIASKSASAPEEILGKTRQMTSLINHTLFSVRRIATELRPGILDDLGLAAAIEWQAHEFQSRTGIRCDFKLLLDPGMVPTDIATQVFRILQETLTNISKHAQATKVIISLGIEHNDLYLEVRDNGKGFAEADLANRRSLGILGMKERALLIGGEVTITGSEGRGTTVHLRAPLSQTGDRRR